MSCCAQPRVRKSDEPEYGMPAQLAALVSAWETIHPGIANAVHEEIATGDWDRQEGSYVPPYESIQTFAVALRVLEAYLLAIHLQHQHRRGPWYVRWGLAKASTALPASSIGFLSAAEQQLGKAATLLESAPQNCSNPVVLQPPAPQALPASWSNPQVSMTFNNQSAPLSRTAQ